MALVLVHVAAVLLRPELGPAVLDLREAPPRVWAASIATLSLLALVALGLSRRRRRPRYEGWRLGHVVLANVALLATALHVLWLDDLTRYPEARIWFVVVGLAMLAAVVHRWLWRPLRSRRNRYVVDEVRRESPTAVTLVLHAAGHQGVRVPPRSVRLAEDRHLARSSSRSTRSRSPPPRRSRGARSSPSRGSATSVTWWRGCARGAACSSTVRTASFTLDGLASDRFVFIAGGVGITPMLSMLRTLADCGDTRPVLLVVAGRTADDLLHRADHEHLDQRLDIQLVEILEEPPDDWDGEVGRFTQDVFERALPLRRRPRGGRLLHLRARAPMVAAATAHHQRPRGARPAHPHRALRRRLSAHLRCRHDLLDRRPGR